MIMTGSKIEKKQNTSVLETTGTLTERMTVCKTMKEKWYIEKKG